jgi:hypothetical protein
MVRADGKFDERAVTRQRHQQPVERQEDEAARFVAAAAQPQRTIRKHCHRHVTGDQVEEIDPEDKGSERAAVAPEQKRIGHHRQERNDVDRVDQRRDDHARTDEKEADQTARAELASQPPRTAGMDQQRLRPPLVVSFAPVR